MRTRQLRLGRPDLSGEIENRYRKEIDVRSKTRLLCVKLAATGEYTSEEIAKICGNSKSSIFVWINAFRKDGFEGLLGREKPGPESGTFRGLPVTVVEELREGVQSGRWATAEAARRWLQQEHKIQKPYVTVWQWLKKLGGVLRVPRPKHPGQNPAAAEAFKKELGQKLEALRIPAGTRVKVWVMDEARFGLHTEVRRVWITKGVRPEVKRQTRYTWDYLYGALEVVEGRAVFAHLPTVNLECNDLFLREIIKMDPEAHHVVIADQAGFHLRPGDNRVPEGVHLISLPPYSPELNPCEQIWDVIKDSEGVANGLFSTVGKLRKAMEPALRRFWEDAAAVLSLVGRPWLHSEANVSYKT
ncbi:MAG: IS630 family transposase [Proteobacteria bacterium]|jgi:transposase|nr:IS630 family transposase [Pseudomonadota bacterium]